MSKLPKLDIFNMITESAFEALDITILEESFVIGTDAKKIRFKAKLQERDAINNNKRRYSDAALRAITGQLAPKANERKLLGEMDHPAPQGDNAAKLKRSSTISLQDCCVLFTKIYYDGKFIIGECETITSAKGPDLYNYLRDQIVIGFSLRAFGATQVTPDGVIEVLSQGLHALTFDVVSNPSHSNSVIYEILNENSTPANTYEIVQMLTESKQNLNQMILTESGGLHLPQKVDTFGLIQEATEAEIQESCGCTGDACLYGTIEESIAFVKNLTSTNLTNKHNNFQF